jgi:CubicO group peptidase (beta-lactamase class C family)
MTLEREPRPDGFVLISASEADMRRQRIVSAVLGVMVAACSSPARAEGTTTTPDRIRRVEDYAARAAALGFSGELLVARNGRVLLQRGYGFADESTGRSNDDRTVFYLASLSKQYTAAAVLKLVADGKVALDDPLSKLLPGVPEDKRAITLRQLLTHQAGLGTFGWNDVAGDWLEADRDAAVAGILGTPLATSPGAKVSYTNAGYVLLAAIVERVSGRPFQEYVALELLAPAGIKTTAFGWTKPSVHDVASGYSGVIARGRYLDRPRSWLRVGPADALSTVGDLYRWVRALQTDRVLPASLRSMMFSVQGEVEPGYGYGFGWWVREDQQHRPRVVFHAGDYPGFHSEVRWYPAQDLTLVVATNQEFRGTSMTETFLNGVLSVLRNGPDPLPSLVESGSRGSKLDGTYCGTDDSCVIVNASGAGLRVEPVGQQLVDWLDGADPSGTAARRADGMRTVDLVLTLKHDGPSAYTDVLADGARNDEPSFEQEWRQIREADGPLHSVQILGTLAPGSEPARSRSLVRMSSERGTRLMSYEWNRGRLEGTNPSAAPEIEPLRFAPEGDGAYVSFDWSSGALLRLRFAPGTLTLVAPSGKTLALARSL